jgi:rhodanese-related sulfurtransferase
VALMLKKRGVYRVRPLAGGFDAWKEQGFPMTEPALVQISGQ